jgi:DNA modification methylase
MDIQRIPVSEINPAPYNPRIDLKLSDPAYIQIKQSIQTFGYVEPLVWNARSKTLVAGHQRLKVLIEQGLEQVDVSVVDLPIEKEKALNIALNKVRGQWDEEKLANILEELMQIPDFEISSIGFDQPEITSLFDKHFNKVDEDDCDVELEVGKIETAITQEGDLIELGPHRIICADSSDIQNLNRLLVDKKAALLHTDPPYNVDYYGGNRPYANGVPKECEHWKKIHADNMPQEKYEEWLKTVLINASTFLIDGAPVYIWNGHRQFAPMYQILSDLEFHISSVITWGKPNFALGYGDYNQQTEFCLYAWKKGKGPHLWYGPANETTLWEVSRDAIKDYIHPTQKPIALAQRAIKNSTLRGEIVLDLFLGSGSTLIAAESLARACYGLEIVSCSLLSRPILIPGGAQNF